MGHAITSKDEDSGHWITPQVDIDSKYQSLTEKGIRKLCSQLLDMKKASVHKLHCSAYSNYSAFVSVSQELLNLEHEVMQLKNHMFEQKDLVNQMKDGGYFNMLNETITAISDDPESLKDDAAVVDEDSSVDELETHTNTICEVLDVLLAEHKMDEALAKLDAEEETSSHYQKTRDPTSPAFLLYQSSLMERKEILSKQLAEVAGQPAVCVTELHKALSGLLRLGNGDVALHLLLNSHRLRIRNNIENLLPSSALYSGTYGVSLAQMIFSVVAQAAKDVYAIFGDNPDYLTELLLWAQKEIRRFVKLVKNYLSSLDAMSSLRAAMMCIQVSVSLSAVLEKHGLLLHAFLLDVMQPFFEGAFDSTIKQLEEEVCSSAANDEWVPSSPVEIEHDIEIENSAHFGCQIKLTSSAYKFYLMIEDLIECMTPFVTVNYRDSILNGLACLFDCYINACIRAIPCLLEDEGNLEFRNNSDSVRAETESQQLAIVGSALALADELMPFSVAKLSKQIGRYENDYPIGSEMQLSQAPPPIDLKDWRRHLQRAADRLRDHFCQQYVLGLIYPREGTVQLSGSSYLNGKSEDLFWDANAMPSSSFQGLFIKLNQLTHLASIVLVGRDKVVKQVFTRLFETIIIWLSDDQDFWEVIEDNSASLTAFGLQQFILDMYFLRQISKFGGYPSKHINQSILEIINRAIKVFSGRGIDPNSALPEDDWFEDTAEASIYKLRDKLLNDSDLNEHMFAVDDATNVRMLSQKGILSEPDSKSVTEASFKNESCESYNNLAIKLNGILRNDTKSNLEEHCDSPSSMVSADSFASAEMEEAENVEATTGEES